MNVHIFQHFATHNHLNARFILYELKVVCFDFKNHSGDDDSLESTGFGGEFNAFGEFAMVFYVVVEVFIV